MYLLQGLPFAMTLSSFWKAVAFSDSEVWILQGRQLGKEDGCELGRVRTSWNPQAWPGTREEETESISAFVASKVGGVSVLQKPGDQGASTWICKEAYVKKIVS